MQAKKSTRDSSGTSLPPPLTPPDCTMSGYPAIMVDISRLRQSDFDATSDDTAWRAGFNLWFSAWESVPAGSLRQDDATLAKAAGIGRDLKTWARIKPTATQGFVLCSDGRIYHRTVCEIVLGAWIDKLIRRHAGQRGNRGAQTPDAKLAELRQIEAQLDTAAACLRLLNHLAPALQKVAKLTRCEPQSEPQCGAQSGGAMRGALPPQYNGSEWNGSKSPSQEGADVVDIGGRVVA